MQTDTISIYKITSAQVQQLQIISRQTFFETFASSNTEENMQNYLSNNLSISKLTEELNNSGSEFYFAEINKQIVGYLKLNFGAAQTEQVSENSVEIERIYILSNYQGKNIGQQLFHKTLSVCKQKSADLIWLGVWEHNTKAIKFYLKNGFTPFNKHVFMLGNDKQTDILMKLFV